MPWQAKDEKFRLCNLKPNQEIAAAIIAAGGSTKAAAEAAGLAPGSIYHWMASLDFQLRVRQLVEERQRAALEAAVTDADMLRQVASGYIGAILPRVATEESRAELARAPRSLASIGQALRAGTVAVQAAHDLRFRALGITSPDGGAGVSVSINNNVAAQANAVALAANEPLREFRDFVVEDLGVPIENVYPRIQWILEQADRDDVKTVILQIGKGGGKTLLASLFLARCLQRVLRHPEPAAAYRLMPGEKIGVLNLSVTGQQAQMAIFDTLCRLVMGSAWFARFEPRPTTDAIEFKSRNVIALSGNSSSRGVEGISWIAAAADEVSRLPEADGRGTVRARELVEPVEDTMLTRFPRDRKALILSWPEHRDDYIEQRVARARKVGVIDDLTEAFRALAITRDNPVMELERRKDLAELPFCNFTSEAFLAADGTLVVVAPMWELKPDCDLEALRQRSVESEYDFARRIAARPLVVGEHPFFRDPDEFARRAAKTRRHPLADDGRFIDDAFRGQENTWYFGHIDLGLRKDAAGLAVAHYAEGAVVYDLLLEVRPPAGGELRIDDLLEVFVSMAKRGFTFAKITRDGYQGIAVGQALQSMGLDTEDYSVDRTRQAYDTFKSAWLAGQLDYYEYEPLNECVRSLIETGRKIDHTPGGKKDVTDAAAAVCYHVLASVGGV